MTGDRPTAQLFRHQALRSALPCSSVSASSDPRQYSQQHPGGKKLLEALLPGAPRPVLSHEELNTHPVACPCQVDASGLGTPGRGLMEAGPLMRADSPGKPSPRGHTWSGSTPPGLAHTTWPCSRSVVAIPGSAVSPLGLAFPGADRNASITGVPGLIPSLSDATGGSPSGWGRVAVARSALPQGDLG